jgi:hypothetical protein
MMMTLERMSISRFHCSEVSMSAANNQIKNTLSTANTADASQPQDKETLFQSHIWNAEHKLYCTTAEGEIHKYDAANGDLLDRYEPKKGLINCIQLTKQHLVAGTTVCD